MCFIQLILYISKYLVKSCKVLAFRNCFFVGVVSDYMLLFYSY